MESVAILPQLFMMSKTGEAETITSHYLFALGKEYIDQIRKYMLKTYGLIPSYHQAVIIALLPED